MKDIDDTIDWYNRRVTEAFEKAPKTSRKDFAIYVTKNYTSLSPYLFAMYDNRPILPLIYKNGFDKIDRVTNISEDG